MAAAEVAAPSAAAVDTSPFHLGEQQVQAQTGSRSVSEQLGRSWHRQQLPPASRNFFAQQQLLYTATLTRGSEERLWATILAGPRAFASATDPQTLKIEPLRQFRGDPARFDEGAFVGTTAIVLETRQRERLNGIVRRRGNGALEVAVQQSFGSCPKYIQARKVEVDDSRLPDVGQMGAVSSGQETLGAAQKEQIESADTMFLATCYLGSLSAGDGVRGADVSHRGGPPGFARVSSAGTVTFADYVGNYTFTTLGNLVLEPRASLLFVDYAKGDTLQLSGRCRILWEERQLPGAQRTMEFVTEQWVQVRGALPLRAPGPVKWSPYNPLPTCKYAAGVGEDRIKQLYNDYVRQDSQCTMPRCLDVRRESHDVVTFEFEAKAPGRGSTDFCVPGQFASFDFEGLGSDGGVVNRTWTVSSPRARMREREAFTITVKKAGLASTWLFENMRPGRTICCRGIDGDFTLARHFGEGAGPPPPRLLFVAGGIGITPMRVMFHECAEQRVAATLLYSMRTLEDAVFADELAEVAQSAADSHLHIAVTGRGECRSPGALAGRADIHQQRIDAALLKKVCPDLSGCVVYQCGPPAMMSAVSDALASLGFPLENLHQEAFNF